MKLVIKGDNKLQVLVIEEDPDTQTLVQHILGPHFELQMAFDFKEAVLLATECSFDMILLDIKLGGDRDGIALLHTLRKMPAYAGVPILAFSAYTLPEDRAYLSGAGFDGFVGKPFTGSELLQALQQAAGHRVRSRVGLRLLQRVDREPVAPPARSTPLRLVQPGETPVPPPGPSPPTVA